MQYFGFAFMTVLSAVFLVPGVYHLYMGILCRREENLHWTLGRRVSTKTVRNVYEPGTWQRKKLPHYTHFTYEYTVEGKIYKLQGSAGIAPGKLPVCPRVVYLKTNPKFAKIQDVWAFHALPMGLFMTSGGLFFAGVATLSLLL
jgi:hypothetical protein